MVALLGLAVFAVALYTALSRTEAAKEAAVVVLIGGVLTVAIKLGSFPAYFALYRGGQTTDPAVARAMLQMNAYAFEITLFTQALLLSGVAIGGLVGGAIPRWLAATAGVLAVARVVSVPVFGSQGFPPLEPCLLARGVGGTRPRDAPRPAAGFELAALSLYCRARGFLTPADKRRVLSAGQVLWWRVRCYAFVVLDSGH